MKAAIFNFQCDQMQNCEGGCETNNIICLYRTEDVVVMYTAVPKTGSTTLTELARHLLWRNEIRNVRISINADIVQEFRCNLSTLDQVSYLYYTYIVFF